jgi:hypothetical protein
MPVVPIKIPAKIEKMDAEERIFVDGCWDGCSIVSLEIT